MCAQDSQKPTPLFADEALAFLLENNFTKLELRVNMPRVGESGFTNDGNTARRAFSDQNNFF